MNGKNFWGNQSCGCKFMVLIALLVVISTLSFFLVIQNLEAKSRLESEQAQVASARTFVSSTVNGFLDKMELYANLASVNSEIRENLYHALATGDAAELNKSAESLANIFATSNLEILDKQGTVLVSTAVPTAVGENRSRLPIVTEAMAGKVKSFLQEAEEADKSWTFKAAAPIYREAELIGIVITSSFVSETLCQDLKEMGGFGISLIVKDKIVASSFPKEKPRQITSRELNFLANKTGILEKIENGIHYHARHLPILGKSGNKLATAIIYVNKTSEETLIDNKLKTGFLTLTLILCFSLALSYKAAKHMAAPLTEMNEFVKEVAAGDLTKEPRLERNDELGLLARNYHNMLINLRQMIKKTITSSRTIDDTTDNLLKEVEVINTSGKKASSMIKTFTFGISAQKKEIERISGRLTELSGAAEEVANSAQNTAASAENINKMAEEGGQTVIEVTNVMQEIETTSDKAVTCISKLKEEAREIGDIVETITHIASQTNLLALNAAIEAARAGEHGLGFAVVASEIRKLAENSTRYAAKIDTIISCIQSSVDEAVHVIEEGNENAAKGTKVVTHIGVSLDSILTSIRSISDKITDISSASQQQSAAIAEVATSMQNMSNIAQSTVSECGTAKAAVDTTANLIQSFSDSFTQMKGLAEELISMMSLFKLNEEIPLPVGLVERQVTPVTVLAEENA